MPKKRYALDRFGRAWLQIEWSGGLFYRQGDLRVLLDRKLVGVIPETVVLKQGAGLTLPDGSQVVISLVKNQLVVSRDGQDVGLIHQQWGEFQAGWISLLVIGGMDLALGTALMGYLRDLGAASFLQPLLIACGIVFLGAGLLGQKRVKAAFYAGIWVWIIQTILILLGMRMHDVYAVGLGALTVVEVFVFWKGAAAVVKTGERAKGGEVR